MPRTTRSTAPGPQADHPAVRRVPRRTPPRAFAPPVILAAALAMAVARAPHLAHAAQPGRPAAGGGRAPADLVLKGGAVYTLDAARSWAGAVAVRGERVVYVGPESGASPYIRPK